MTTHFINYNGQLINEDQNLFGINDQFVRYGDGLFETMLWKDGDIRFLDLHIERLQKGMRLLGYENRDVFDAYFLKMIAQELVHKNKLIGKRARLRLSVFRDSRGEGLSSFSNKAAYVLQVSGLPPEIRQKGLIVDLYTQVRKPFGDLSALKTNSFLVYVLAANFKKQMGVDEVFVLNQENLLCDGSQSNVFVYYQQNLYTPAISQGCVEGTMRKVVIDIAASLGIEVIEAELGPEILSKADEVFCTNAIRGVQWVKGYKHKRYFNIISKELHQALETWEYKKAPSDSENTPSE